LNNFIVYHKETGVVYGLRPIDAASMVSETYAELPTDLKELPELVGYIGEVYWNPEMRCVEDDRELAWEYVVRDGALVRRDWRMRVAEGELTLEQLKDKLRKVLRRNYATDAAQTDGPVIAALKRTALGTIVPEDAVKRQKALETYAKLTSEYRACIDALDGSEDVEAVCAMFDIANKRTAG